MTPLSEPACTRSSAGPHAIRTTRLRPDTGPLRDSRLCDALPVGVLPTGTLDWCVDVLQRAAGLLNARSGDGSGSRWVVDRDLAACHLLAPWVIAAANALAPPPPPRPPLPAPGGGWVDVDPGPDDHDTWDRLRAVLRQEAAEGAALPDAEEVTRRAQEWRLPVTPYRTRSAAGTDHIPVGTTLALDNHRHQQHGDHTDHLGDLRHVASPDSPGWVRQPGTPGARTTAMDHVGDRNHHVQRTADPVAPLAGVTVIDLTVLWAGPLATWLLAGLGARVIKIEPAARPDGLRRGDRPASAGPGDGALFVALDHGKEHCQLDLRRPADHARFLELVSTTDVMIDNLSRRVRPNLGIGPDRLRQVRPELIDLSLRAFDPLGPEADWVAHGGGVHAASGLAAVGPDGVPQPALINYPDPVTGFSAFELLVAALRARSDGELPVPMVLSLERAVRPLYDKAAPPDPSSRRIDTESPGRAGAAGRSGGSVMSGRVDPASTADARAAGLWQWAIVAAERATVMADGCRGLPSPLRMTSGGVTP